MAVKAATEETTKTTNQVVPSSPRLTDEVRAILEAPVPASEIKSYPGKGGKEMRYTSVEFVEDRIRQVDPDFGCDVVEGPRGITVHYTILGVRRGDIFDTEEDAKFGTPLTGSIARAKRRAAKSGFGIAKELWADEEDRQATGGSHSRQQSGERKAPSDKQVTILTDLGIPEPVARGINAWIRGKDSNNQPISDVSNVIKALWDARGKGNRGPVERRVWEPVVRQYAPNALSSVTTTGATDDDADDEWAS